MSPIYTCGLGSKYCKLYSCRTNPREKDVQCRCKSLGTREPASPEESMEDYWLVCGYLFDRSVVKTSGGTGDRANASEASPTEQSIRRKDALKKKKQLEDPGMSKGDIKAQTTRKPQPQEKHYDDCGSDTGRVEEVYNQALLAHSRGSIDDAVAFSYFDVPVCSSVPDGYEELLRENHFHLHCSLGSEVEEDHAAFIHKPKDASSVKADQLLAFLAEPDLEGNMDVMEVAGGESGISKLSIRRKLKTGKVFDLVTGSDVTEAADQKILLDYIREHRPMVIVAGPPCTALQASVESIGGNIQTPMRNPGKHE